MRDEFEKKVKEHLEERQLPVSGDAWDKLSQMLEKEERRQRVKLWIHLSIAVSLALLFGIVFINNNKVNSEFEEMKISNQTQAEEKLPVIIENDERESQNLIEDKTTKPIPKTMIQKSERLVILSQDLNHKIVSEEPFPVGNSIPTVEDNPEELMADAVVPEKIQNEPEIEVVKNKISEPKEKVKYTNPNLLLYSVENNETLNQTKEGFRLVLIDFNK